MNFGLSEDQLLFKQTLRRFVEEQCPTSRVRAVMESDSGHDNGLWQSLAEIGVPGLIVPASFGGAGLEMLELTPLTVVDRTRRLSSVTFRNSPAVKLRGGAHGLSRSLDAGAVLLAADAFGGAKRCLETTVRYALERVQFGQPIGAFQAVKHQLANLACDLEPALSLWWYAAHAFDRIRDQ